MVAPLLERFAAGVWCRKTLLPDGNRSGSGRHDRVPVTAGTTCRPPCG